MPIPPTAAPLASTQNSVTGSEFITDFRKVLASSIVYGCGKRSRNAIQTLRSFACFVSDSASSSRHGRMVHRSSVSCMCYTYTQPAFALWESTEGVALRRREVRLQEGVRRGLAELAPPFAVRRRI